MMDWATVIVICVFLICCTGAICFRWYLQCRFEEKELDIKDRHPERPKE